MARMLIFTVLICTLALFVDLAYAQNQPPAEGTWPQWRGPTRDGKLAASHIWPEKLGDDQLKKLWRVPLGPSYSGPIVSDSMVFVTATQDASAEVVRALDRNTGKQLWEASWDGAMEVPFFAKSNGDWIRATPTLDDGRLYVAGMRDLMICLDTNTGKIVWQFDFVKQLNTDLPAFGQASSPLVDGPYLYCQAGSGVCKLDKQSGELIWRGVIDAGGMHGSAFSSPIIAEIAGKKQLIVQTREKLVGVDLETGKEIWSQIIPAFRGMNILTPTVVGDSIFTSAYGGQSFLFNIQSVTNAGLTIKESWTNRARGYMSSPVIIEGNLYLHLQNQRFVAIDLKSGKTLWTSKPHGKYCSLVAQGDKILALDQRGELLLIRANREKFDLIDSRKISDEETWGHLAVCGNEIFVRELQAISAFQWGTSD